jgi:CBS domain-containing protein
MKAADVMVSNVITVGVNASIGEVAAILLNNHISAAPVVDEKGDLVGIVSEGDLIRRPEIGTAKRHSWWLELISNKWASASEYIKSHSRMVADVMTRDVITAKPDTPLGDIAAMLERNRIKRVPIVDGGKLVGLVSRGNILILSLKDADAYSTSRPLSGGGPRRISCMLTHDPSQWWVASSTSWS